MLRKERDGERRLAGRAADDWSRRTATQIEAYEDFAAELGHEPGDVALAWLLHQPAVTAPIIGPRTLEQLDVGRPRRSTSRSTTRRSTRLDEIFPGHRTAPEDYAW